MQIKHSNGEITWAAGYLRRVVWHKKNNNNSEIISTSMIFKAMRMDKITLEEALIEKRKGLRTESQDIPIFTSENMRNNQQNKIKYV